MDAQMAEKVNQLAKSLKDTHLAANMEEATEKARQILERGVPPGKDNGTSISEQIKITEEEKEIKTVDEVFKEEQEAEEKVEEAQDELEEIGKEAEEEQEAVDDVQEEIKKLDEEIEEETEEISEMKGRLNDDFGKEDEEEKEEE